MKIRALLAGVARAARALLAAVRAPGPAAASRRRGEALYCRVRRASVLGTPVLVCELDVPASRLHDVALRLAAAAAAAAEALGRNLGIVGIVPEEEPQLVALAPRRDLVAVRFVDDLTAGASHLRPHLWLPLAAGEYLADLVDPLVPFAATASELARLGGRAGSAGALLVAVEGGSSSVLVRVEICAARPQLRRWFSSGRRQLASLSGWSPGRR